MKNIHILPTDKPSRLYLGDNGNFVFGMMQNSVRSKNDSFTNQNIYITFDEEIKEGDWCLCSEELIHKVVEIKSNIGIIRFQDGVTEVLDACKKIILTTDELYIHNDLIPKEYNLFPQYIQKIDDEFLEWFVKNPSCEEVDTILKDGWCLEKAITIPNSFYKIIIPKEETLTYSDALKKEERIFNSTMMFKQFQLLEEFINSQPYYGSCTTEYLEGIEEGAKWQQERMYSEEEVIELLQKALTHKDDGEIGSLITAQGEIRTANFYSWFEQVKNK